MFNFDIFPESSYDDTSGEYSYYFDFNPDPSGTVLLTESGKTYATVYNFDEPDEVTRILRILAEIANSRQFEPDYNPKNPENFPDCDEELDKDDYTNVRGPYVYEQVKRFLEKTGLGNITQACYDSELDAFWLTIDSPRFIKTHKRGSRKSTRKR